MRRGDEDGSAGSVNYIHNYADGDLLYCDMCAAEAARITHKHPLGFIPSAILNHILMEIQKERSSFGGCYREALRHL